MTQISFEHLFLAKPSQPPLTGRELRDSGIQSALDHVEARKGEYVTQALSAIQCLPSDALLTAETIRDAIGDAPAGCENCFAGILKKAASMKLIVITNSFTQAKRAQRHAGLIRQWRRI